jgi:hypothetical protein
MEDRSNSQLQIRWRSLEVSKSRSDEPSVIIVTIRIHALMFLVGSEFQRFSGRSAKIIRRFHGIRLGLPKYLLFVGSNLPSICLLERHKQRMMSVWPTKGFRDRCSRRLCRLARWSSRCGIRTAIGSRRQNRKRNAFHFEKIHSQELAPLSEELIFLGNPVFVFTRLYHGKFSSRIPYIF